MNRREILKLLRSEYELARTELVAAVMVDGDIVEVPGDKVTVLRQAKERLEKALGEPVSF